MDKMEAWFALNNLRRCYAWTHALWSAAAGIRSARLVILFLVSWGGLWSWREPPGGCWKPQQHNHRRRREHGKAAGAHQGSASNFVFRRVIDEWRVFNHDGGTSYRPLRLTMVELGGARQKLHKRGTFYPVTACSLVELADEVSRTAPDGLGRTN